jgi:hypothetical protein
MQSFDDLILPMKSKVAATTFDNYKGRLRAVAKICVGMSAMQILTDPDKAYPMIVAKFQGKDSSIANYNNNNRNSKGVVLKGTRARP